jgi:hypothetical protein
MTRAIAILLALLLFARAAEARPGRAMKIAGIVTVAFGLALLVGGVALIATGSSCQPQDSYSCGELGGGVQLIGGIALLSAGVIAEAVGIPLWVVGQRREARVSLAPTRLALSW